MIGRREFIVSGAAGLITAHAAGAQVVGQPLLIVFPALIGRSAPQAERLARFRGEMRRLGHVEGRDFLIDLARGGDPAEELRRQLALSPGVIITSNSPLAASAAAATSTIPILGAVLGDAATQRELIGVDFSRPKGNVTGIGQGGLEVPKVMELARALLPAAQAVGCLEATTIQRKDAEDAARTLGLRLTFHVGDDRDAILSAFERFARERVDAVLTTLNYGDERPEPEFRRFSLMTRIPVLYSRIECVEAGGFMSYGTDNRDNYERLASFVDRLLRGAKVADMPFEQDVAYRLAINLRTAGELGFEIPPRILARADVVIE